MPTPKLDEDKLGAALAVVIAEARFKRGLSRNELAVKTGFHRSYVGDIETGVRAISIKTLSRLAQALEVSASKLMAAAERRVREENEST